MLSVDELCAIFCMTRAARALKIACDSRKQKWYRLNRPFRFHPILIITAFFNRSYFASPLVSLYCAVRFVDKTHDVFPTNQKSNPNQSWLDRFSFSRAWHCTYFCPKTRKMETRPTVTFFSSLLSVIVAYQCINLAFLSVLISQNRRSNVSGERLKGGNLNSWLRSEILENDLLPEDNSAHLRF